MVKSWKTTAVGLSQLVLGIIAFALFAIGKIDYIALGGSLGFIGAFGGFVGNLFAKDSDVSHSVDVKASIRKDDYKDIGGDGIDPGEREGNE